MSGYETSSQYLILKEHIRVGIVSNNFHRNSCLHSNQRLSFNFFFFFSFFSGTFQGHYLPHCSSLYFSHIVKTAHQSTLHRFYSGEGSMQKGQHTVILKLETRKLFKQWQFPLPPDFFFLHLHLVSCPSGPLSPSSSATSVHCLHSSPTRSILELFCYQ